MVIFCTNCGNKLDDDAAFCTKCGTKVLNVEEAKKNSESGLRGKIREKEAEINKKSTGFLSRVKEKTEEARIESFKRESKKGNIPRFGGITEYREDSIVIKKTGEVIPIAEMSNFSIHQSSQTLYSDVKVDFDYNGLHYRTQVIGSDKGKLQTIEKKINAIEMSKFTNSLNNNNNTTNNVDAGKSKADKLREIKELLDEGIIDEEEFKELKSEIING